MGGPMDYSPNADQGVADQPDEFAIRHHFRPNIANQLPYSYFLEAENGSGLFRLMATRLAIK